MSKLNASCSGVAWLLLRLAEDHFVVLDQLSITSVVLAEREEFLELLLRNFLRLGVVNFFRRLSLAEVSVVVVHWLVYEGDSVEVLLHHVLAQRRL